MAEVALTAEVRLEQGSSASRRLRNSGSIPGVLYGHGIDPTPLSINARSLRQALNTDAGLNALIQLDVDGTQHLALPRDIQRHPVRNTVIHIDFQVVNRDELMTVDVPVQFVGEATGVVKNGGIVEHVLQAISVSATPSDIPAHLTVDVSSLQIDGVIRVKDVKLPRGVTAHMESSEVVAAGKKTRAAASTTTDAAESEESAG